MAMLANDNKTIVKNDGTKVTSSIMKVETRYGSRLFTNLGNGVLTEDKGIVYLLTDDGAYLQII